MKAKEHKRQRKDSDSYSPSDKHDVKEKSSFSSNKKYKMLCDSEEASLERAIFGDAHDIVQNLLGEDDLATTIKEENSITETKNNDSDSDSQFQYSDSDAENDSEENSENDGYDSDISDSQKVKGKAWVDEDDGQYSVQKAFQAQNRKPRGDEAEKTYKELLHKKFEAIHGTPNWAKLDKKEDIDSDESDSEILKHSNHKVAIKTKKLRKGVIELKVLTDINRKTHSEGPYITSVQFHPTSTVAFVAGSAGVISLFEVDGKENNKLHSFKLQKFPINTARFLKDGSEIVAGSMSFSHCYTYDLISGNTRKVPLPHGITNMKKFEVSPDGKYIAVCGRSGEVYVLSGVTKELIHTFKMNKKCNAVAFTPDSQKLFANGHCFEMYLWDMRNLACIQRPIDDGCLSAASIAISSSGQFVATGSKQGIVNIYDANSVQRDNTPKPLKTISNLTTSITSLKFNPTSEILAIASSKARNAFKLAHIPSFTVFSNFPTFQTKMYNPLAIDYSPNSGFLSVSNDKGHAYLYRLKHFGNY